MTGKYYWMRKGNTSLSFDLVLPSRAVHRIIIMDSATSGETKREIFFFKKGSGGMHAELMGDYKEN